MDNNAIINDFLINIKELIKWRNVEKKSEALQLEEIKIRNYMLSGGEYVIKKIEKVILKELFSEDEKYNIYLYSFLITHYRSTKYVNSFIKYIIDEKNISLNNKYFLFEQLKSRIFSMKVKCDEETKELMWNLYIHIYLYVKQRFNSYNKIPKEERQEELIVIITSQFLGVNHAPTKIALDRACLLSKNLNKKVIIINTCELLNTAGKMDISNCVKANKTSVYENISRIKYEGIEIGMYQSKVKMPNFSEYKRILDYLVSNKPYMVIGIGGSSLAADLANLVVPTITISLSSELAISMSDFSVICKKPTELEYKMLNESGRSKESVIVSIPSYNLIKQEKSLNRDELGISKEKMIITVIGNRLDCEVDTELLESLDFMARENGYIIFVGEFKDVHKRVTKYKNLKKSYKYMGYQEDLLSIIEVSDVNVNPRRNGGATSAVYSLYKGKPVLTVPYGDVASVVGDKFIVEDFKEMVNVFKKLSENKEFYEEMSNMALNRSKDIVENKTNFINVYNAIKESELFI